MLALNATVPIAAAAEGTAPATPSTTFLPNRVIVEWAPGTSRSEKSAARKDAEVDLKANLGDPTFQLVKVEPGQSAAAAIGELEANPVVVVAERDSLSAPAAIPDDPLFDQLWGLENLGAGIAGFPGATAGADIDALGAWDSTVGIPSTVVADIDSGYRFDDPDLGPVAWDNPGEVAGNGVDDDGNGYVDDLHGYDFVGGSADSPSEDDDPTDDNIISGGHGLHTAGTIGAAGDNGVGITGVAQDVRIMPLRVCANSAASNNEGRCPVSSIIAAINYAGANGARVANLSLSGTEPSVASLDAFAANPQTLYVASAGNDSEDNDASPRYPCNYEPTTSGIDGAIENIVCVAATDQADGLASFSDWGSTSVDLGAPGTEILSTYPAIEDLLGEDFEEDDFGSHWTAVGPDGGFGRTTETPLTSFGISDSPEETPVADSVRESILTTGVAVPSGYGSCRFSGRRLVSLGGGTFTQTVFKDGVSVFNSQPASTSGEEMRGFSTVPILGLGGSSVTIRFRFEAGPSPSDSSGVWLDDLKLSCYGPADAPLTYAFLQGTSMAAPHVTGAGALLFSMKPAATVTEVRQTLLSGVDPDPSLAGLTVTGGRLNASSALDALDFIAPAAPELTGTDPSSPAAENQPRIVGSAEAGSSVEIYAGDSCAGAPVASGTAGELAAPGIAVTVPDDSTTQFSATATDAAANTSACSTPISYTNSTKPIVVSPGEVIVTELLELPPANPAPGATLSPPVIPPCTVPRLAGKTLAQAKVALGRAGCRVGRVSKPKAKKGQAAALVVRASSPAAGSRAGAVALVLGAKPKRHRH